MKVLHILDSLNRGGAEMLMLDLCRAAKSHGLELSFMATGGGTLEEEFKSSGVPFHRLQRRLPFDPVLVLQMRGIFKRERYDIIHNYQAVAGIHAYTAALGLGVRHVLGFQGFYGDLKNRLATKFLVPRMTANVSCSNGLLDWLRESEGVDTDGFKVVFNGADPARLMGDGKKFRAELGVGGDAILIGMLAHFYAAPRKDHATLCRAFVRIAESVPNAHLVLAGKTEEGAAWKREECERICADAGVSERVHFLGFRNDVADILDALDVNVLSSVHEGLPVSIAEAMLVGKACALSDIPPHVEVSAHGQYAKLFPTGDDSALAEILNALSKDHSVRNALASKAKAYADRSLSIGAHIEALKNIYGAIV